MQVAEFPEKLERIFEPHRYKVLYGGRGGGKSWAIARALVVMGAAQPLRILCAREFQKSMRQSVHKLLSDQIVALGLQECYVVQNDAIIGTNGTEITFHGLHHNVDNIKSLEGIDICWVEEARNVSSNSWEKLIPTIRKPGSQIWMSFNPELAEDITYTKFVMNSPPDTLLIKIDWRDNPWFTKELLDEMHHMKSQDIDKYMNVYEGHCKQTVDGAIFAHEVRKAMSDGRITKVPYISGKSVLTAWDLGHYDKTAIWFWQIGGPGQIHVIDYYENQGQKMGHYLQVLQSRGYVYGTHYLPHDAANETVAAEKTPEGQVKAAGYTCKVLERSSISTGIDAARNVFENCIFDEEKTKDGLQCLRNYRYEVDDETGQFSKKPLHDWSSHGADAFRYMAVSMKEQKERKTFDPGKYTKGDSWMSA